MNSHSPESLSISPEARDRFRKKYHLNEGANTHETELAVRQFVGTSLKGQFEDPRVVLAAVKFGQLAYDLETGLGKRDYIILEAQRNAEKLCLSPEEIELTKQKAAELYVQFKILSGSSSDAQAPTEVFGCLVDAKEAARKLEDEARQKQAADKRGRSRLRLEGRFQKLMSVSDEELRIQLCNKRVDLKDNQVYCGADAVTRKSIRTRTLSRERYQDKLRDVRGVGNVIALNLSGVKRDEILTQARTLLDGGKYLVHDVVPDKMGEFSEVFLSLLTGVRVSKAAFEKRGIDADLLQSKIRSFLTSYKIRKAEEDYIKNPGLNERRVHTRRGMDPHRFLNDGSHRKLLGYIQGQPKID